MKNGNNVINDFWKINLVCLNIYLSTKSFIDLIIQSPWMFLCWQIQIQELCPFKIVKYNVKLMC
jgi:hypothetical protein